MTKTLLPAYTPKARRPRRFASRFHTDIYAPADRTIVRAHGEIDRATRTAFRAALTTGLDRQPSLLIVDLKAWREGCGDVAKPLEPTEPVMPTSSVAPTSQRGVRG
ncbi:hypothetical protein [Frankia canadensis]|nr:hypothetical protein [Frankia canadensis]